MFPHGILLTNFLDILIQVPESISALNVSTADAANHPAVLLSRLVTAPFVHWILTENPSAFLLKARWKFMTTILAIVASPSLGSMRGYQVF